MAATGLAILIHNPLVHDPWMSIKTWLKSLSSPNHHANKGGLLADQTSMTRKVPEGNGAVSQVCGPKSDGGLSASGVPWCQAVR